MGVPFDITIQRSELSPNSVWCFFEEIRDVDNLDPAEEQNEPWECMKDGERIGMAVVDTFGSDGVFINRIAVDKSFRECGVATALLETVANEYDVLRCRVHVDNTASQNLMEEFGFERDGMGRYDELIHYRFDS